MSTHEDRALARRVERLETENEELREKIAYLTGVLTPPISLPFGLQLSPSLDKVLRVIASREYATADMIHAALDWDKADPLESRNAQVYVSKLRRKLKPFGVVINNRWGVGYYIDAASKARLKSIEERAAA